MRLPIADSRDDYPPPLPFLHRAGYEDERSSRTGPAPPFQACPFSLRYRGGWWPHATCDGCRVGLLRSPFSPAPPGAGRALFPSGDGDTQCSKIHSNDPSKLAGTLLEAGLISLLLRAWTSTAFLKMRLIPCARSASKGNQQPSPLFPYRARCEAGWADWRQDPPSIL